MSGAPADDPILAALAALDAKLSAGFERTDARMEQLDEGQARLRVDLMARMERLEDAIGLIRDDITVNFGAVDQAKMVNDHTRDELRALGTVVSGMMKIILKLQTEVAAIQGGHTRPGTPP